MKTVSHALFALILAGFTILSPTSDAAPISLHPDNPHYFLFEDQPAILITSGEHYGAVLNLDFDYVRYFETLQADGLNNTRTFTGAYVEPPGAFNIARNTLAPAPNRFICPWARSSTPGYANGGNKFDLTQWNDAYFNRLKDFVKEAGRRGIVVELDLFCPFYSEAQWAISPQNAQNNVNGWGDVARTNVYTLDKNGGLLPVQEAMVRKIVQELNPYDNLYYEICNEPYFGGVTMDWQHRMAEVIVETERALPKKHLISRNVANGQEKVENPHAAISVFNFHYAHPPNAVPMNYSLNKPIGDNETGFRGTNNLAYRVEAWAFLLAGGALYNNLDYSFTAGHEDGSFAYPSSQPGGGNPVFRRQLRVLKDFLYGFDFLRMKPDPSIVKGGIPDDSDVRALVRSGEAYAIFIGPAKISKGNVEQLSKRRQRTELVLELPRGAYHAEWIDTETGEVPKSESFEHSGGELALASPEFGPDVALRVMRQSPETAAMTVMSYNLRYASATGANAWPVRRPVMRECIRSIQPDLIGTQEGVFAQLKDLARDLPEYEWIGLGRDGGSRGEFMAVFYRRNRFEPVEYDHFWLSDTPNAVASTTWGNSNRRMVTWVKFRDRQTGREFYFANTHFDHQIQLAREKSAELVRERLAALPAGVPILLVGDFNATAEKNKAYQILVDDGGFTDSWKTAPKRQGEGLNTFNGFRDGSHTGGNRIDWILYRGPVTVDEAAIVDFSKDGQYPSDHFPVVAWLKL